MVIEFIPSSFGYVSSSKMWFTNSGSRRMHGDPAPPGAGEDGAHIALSRSSTLIYPIPADTRTGSPLNAYSAS
jgi:hypothetical protein